LLSQRFQVTRYNDDGWRGGAGVDCGALSSEDFDAIVFFQLIPNGSMLRQIRCRTVIVVPMYDSAYGLRGFEWLPQIRCKYLNFSMNLHRIILSSGGESLNVQYFPDPSKYQMVKNNDGPPRAFFWQRGNDITWTTVRRLIGRPEVMDGVHLHLAPDPGCRVVSPNEGECREFRISLSEWFPHRSDYLLECMKARIFFAPRIREGVGMSFLEAMAQGNCVVAADSPTMNEYISNGETGLLYNPVDPRPLDFSNAHYIGARARELVDAGHAAWKDRAAEILEYIESPVAAKRKAWSLSRRMASRAQYRWWRINKWIAVIGKRFFGGK
jgi:hypothetical protein